MKNKKKSKIIEYFIALFTVPLNCLFLKDLNCVLYPPYKF